MKIKLKESYGNEFTTTHKGTVIRKGEWLDYDGNDHEVEHLLKQGIFDIQDDIKELKPEVIKEPKVEEPKVEEPKVEEPKVEEPKVEEPKVEETAMDVTKEDEAFVEKELNKNDIEDQKAETTINIKNV